MRVGNQIWAAERLLTGLAWGATGSGSLTGWPFVGDEICYDRG